MKAFDYKALKAGTRAALGQAQYSPKRLVAIYAGATLGVNLLLSVLQYMLSTAMTGSGGLGDMGTLAALETVQVFLQLLGVLLIPFWQLGFVAAVLQLVRRQPAEPMTLLEGFRHWGVVLRSYLLKSILMMGAMMAVSYPVAFLYTMTPLAAPLVRMMEEQMASGTMDMNVLMTEEMLSYMMKTYLPMLVPFLGAALIFVGYRLRLMDYIVMDEPRKGAFYALRTSLRRMRKNSFAMFKLDLRLWWYYALELLASAVVWGDVILNLCGVQTGLDPQIMSMLFLLLGSLLQLALYVWKMDFVAVLYGQAYQVLTPPPVEEE